MVDYIIHYIMAITNILGDPMVFLGEDPLVFLGDGTNITMKNRAYNSNLMVNYHNSQ